MKRFRVLFFVVLAAVLGLGTYAWFSKQRGASSSNRITDGGANDTVLAVYKQLVKAMQTGDGNLSVSLMSQKKIEEAKNAQVLNQLRQGYPADPSVQYELLGIKTRRDHAAILAKIVSSDGPAQYHLVKFIRENGGWKIAEEGVDSEPINHAVLEAAIPPEDSTFARAGSPWDKVSYASENTTRVKEDQINWKLKATNDESFLYIRFESTMPLTAPGTELAADEARASSSTPDVMVIKIASGKQFFLVIGASPTTRGTFDEAGHATSNRYFAQYSFSVKDATRETLFSDSTKDTYDPLIAIQSSFMDIRIPLKCLGPDTASTGIGMSEANSVAKILPYSVQRFSGP